MNGDSNEYENEEQLQMDESGLQMSKLARFPHESFDISSFNESKSAHDFPNKYLKSVFPIINAPTLEVDPSSMNTYLDKNKKQNDQESYHEHEDCISKIKELNDKNLQLEKVIRDKDKLIQEKEQMLLFAQKKFRKGENSGQNSLNIQQGKDKQKIDTPYIDQFCPEFLSPQESIQLFGNLLSKLSKSATSKRKILSDRKMVELLTQMLKTK